MTSPLPQAEETTPVPQHEDEAERLRQLRSLLVGPEQEQIESLRKRLDDPVARSEDLSHSIAEAIALRAKQDHKLQTTLQPLLEEALRISVARNPAMLGTALFPIIGDAVRKAVAHALQGMFESLNLMLDRGLSLESWRWRFEAWRTGRSFGEVALTHSLNYRVEQVFLIHRETGLLLGHVTFAEGVVQDADLVSGMLTAVQDFVRDSFSPDVSDQLEVMQVGAFKLWLVHSPLLLLAAVVSGHPPPELREVFVREIEAIHNEYSAVLENFDGDTAAVAGAEANLRRCLLGAQKVAKVRKSHRMLWIAAFVVLAVIATLIGLRIRGNRRWEHYVADVRTHPGIIVLSTQRHWFSYDISGLRDPLAADPWRSLGSFRVPEWRVFEHWEPYMSLDPRFQGLRRLDEETARLDREVLHFDLNSAQIPMSQFAGIEQVVAGMTEIRQIAMANDLRVRLEIYGHTDRSGKEEHNVALSQARAQAVADALGMQGIPAEEMRAAGVADANPDRTNLIAYPQELDRRVTFRVLLTRDEGSK